jgi:hypothetical protein
MWLAPNGFLGISKMNLVHTPNLVLWYPKGSTFDLLGYSDSDYAGCKVDRKSTIGTCQFLGRSLVSWSSKKQNSVALSTAEAVNVEAGACCAQLLWMKQTLSDYGCEFSNIPLLCDNESAIKLANNLIQHSRTKHIDIRHHFLRDHEAKGDIALRHATRGNLPISWLTSRRAKVLCFEKWAKHLGFS